MESRVIGPRGRRRGVLGPVAALVLLTLLPMTPTRSDEPPAGPLVREESRVFDIRFEVVISTMVPFGQDDPRLVRDQYLSNQPGGQTFRYRRDINDVAWGEPFRLVDTPIVMPLMAEGTYHTIDLDSVDAKLWLGAREDQSLRGRFRIDDGLPYQGKLAVLPIVEFDGRSIRWNITYRVDTYSSRLEEEWAQRITWPREWPDEVQAALEPQLYIESDAPIVHETLARLTNSRYKFMTPYLAAKEIVRLGMGDVRTTRPRLHRGRAGVLHGLEVIGAVATLEDGGGSPNDVVCVTIALLRAAGIPARPVIGIGKDDRDRTTLFTWGEFYLVGAGWVPFDPEEMSGRGIRNWKLERPWDYFGTLDDLNRRIPLAYHFVPPRAVESPLSPAVWGWDPRPSRARQTEQRITLDMTSRGLRRNMKRATD